MVRTARAAVAATVLSMSACSGPTRAPMPRADHQAGVDAALVAALREAPIRAAAARTARYRVVVPFPGSAGLAEITTTGAYDLDADRTERVTTYGGAIEQLPEWRGVAPAGFEEGVALVTDGDRAYLRVPLIAPRIGTAAWVSGPRGARPVVVAHLEAHGALDALTVLEALRGLDGNVTEMGDDEIRGVHTSHVVGRVDRLDGALAYGATSLDVDVWVDDLGRVCRLVLHIEGDTAITVELYDYGRPVDIELPPPDEVIPFDDLPWEAEE